MIATAARRPKDGMPNAMKKRPSKRAAKGRGRPPLPAGERLSVVVHIRMTPDEYALLDEAAASTGETIAGFTRISVVENARRVLGRES